MAVVEIVRFLRLVKVVIKLENTSKLLVAVDFVKSVRPTTLQASHVLLESGPSNDDNPTFQLLLPPLHRLQVGGGRLSAREQGKCNQKRAGDRAIPYCRKRPS